MEYSKLIRPLIIGVTLSALVFLSYHRGLLEVPELKSLDLRFQIRGPVSPQLPIILVSIDEDSFDELNLSWPWPRTLHALLIRKLAASQAKLIAFDILFTEPKSDSREDWLLAREIKEAGNVILAAVKTEVDSDFGPKERMLLPTPLIREHALGYGPVNLDTDQDGVVRRAKLGLPFQGKVYPHFAYRIYQRAVGEKKLGGEEISPTTYLINFRGPARSYPIVPYYRILKDEIDPSIFRDKIVLVGMFSPSLHDIFPTPFSASRPTAGVEIQVNFVETLVANDPITPFPDWGHSAIFILLSAITIWISFYFKPLRAFAVVLVLASAYAFAGLYLFSIHQLWVPVVPPLLGIVLSYGGITLDNYIREQKERIRLRATFSKYVSSDVVEEILDDREGLALGGKRRHITVLFSDIRGFTSISEQIGPEQVVSLLSDYLGQVTHIVFKHGGTIDKFIGDAVFAIFGAPKSYQDDAARAVKTGLEMIELVESLGPKWTKMIGRPLKVGVGINSGEAVVGSIGSEIRADFTAIGDTVNLGSRLEGLTKELGVPMLISESSAAELKDSIPLRPLRQVKVQGRETPLLVYCPESLLEGEIEFALDTTMPYVQQHK
ncbi:MAG: CHASE2 domain-containing protein [Candidatus Binatia bacterium]